MHFDNLGLSDYYFIDPHWLYYVFCQVCISSMLTCSSKIDSKYPDFNMLCDLLYNPICITVYIENAQYSLCILY